MTTARTTAHSPQAFWAYSIVRIITAEAVTAEAVTDSSGNRVRDTTSAFQSTYPIYSFSTLGYTSSPPTRSMSPNLTSTLVSTKTEANEPVFTGFNSNVNSYFFANQTTTQTGVVISLTTLFVYAPAQGATLLSGEPEGCNQGTGMENYGYLAQILLDYIVKNPAYSSQCLGLENCPPSGPAVIKLQSCSAAGPHYRVPGGDLNSSTMITVTPIGVTAQPEPAGSPMTASPTQKALTSTGVAVSLPSSILPSETQSVVPSMQIDTPSPSPPFTEISAVVNSPTSSPNAPESQSTSTSANAPEALSLPVSPNSLSLASSSAAVITNAMAYGIGATPTTGAPTIISRTSEIVVSGETTIPRQSLETRTSLIFRVVPLFP